MSEVNNTIISSKFSFFEHITPTNKSFSWKIAVFNTTVFCLIAIIDTWGSRLSKNSFHCPWGYWVLLAAIPLVLGSYLLSRLMKRWLYQILSPYIFTVIVCWLVSLFDFSPPLPNLWQMLTFACVPLIGLLATVIRYYTPRVQSEIDLAKVDVKARIIWVQEKSNTWRNLGIGIVVPAIAFLAFWYPYISNAVTSAYTEPQRGYCLGLWAIMATDVALYMILGPICECFRKADQIMNMLLDIKK